jgi:hypothetical protein
MPLSYVELDYINDKMNQILDQKILKCNKPSFYAQQLVNLYSLMHIHEKDYPITDPYNLYQHDSFYEPLSYSKDIQQILKNKMMNIVKKYSRVYKLAVLEQCSNHSLSLY